MSVRLLSLLLLPGCLAGITTGAVVPTGPGGVSGPPAGTVARASSYTAGDEPTGVELRIFGAGRGIEDNPLMPNAYGLTYRQIGDEHVATAGQIGWAGVHKLGDGFVFGRLMFDVINSQRTLDGDRKFSAFSPTLDLGIAPIKNGLCFSASATYDIHFNDPDRMIFGLFAGLCASDQTRH
jgi:hypothetical protein